MLNNGRDLGLLFMYEVQLFLGVIYCVFVPFVQQLYGLLTKK